MSQPVDEARYARQILLPEIGRVGQARIAAAVAPVGGDGFVHEVAVRYALRAGFAEVSTAALDQDRSMALTPGAPPPAAVATGPTPGASGYTFFSRTADDVHRGARMTLAAIREVIDP